MNYNCPIKDSPFNLKFVTNQRTLCGSNKFPYRNLREIDYGYQGRGQEFVQGRSNFFLSRGSHFFFSRGPAQHPLGPEVHRFHRFFNAEKLKIFSLELGLNNGSKYGLNSIETNKTYKQTEITTLSITLLVWVSVCLFVLIIKLFAYI